MTQPENYKRRRSAISIMARLIVLVRPLIPVMVLAVLFGVLGYLCAIFLTIVASYEIASGLSSVATFSQNFGNAAILDLVVMVIFNLVTEIMLLFGGGLPDGWSLSGSALGIVITCLVVMGLMRGILHYAEQYCNHYIAFRLLAIVRHKVFAQLRRLSPAKLEGRDRGDLVSLITSDIELLEVFYAHTISPILIATIVSAFMVWFIGQQAFAAGVLAAVAYVVIGVILPSIIGHAGSQPGLRFRNAFGELNTFVLDSLRGVDETIQFGSGSERLEQISQRSRDLSNMQKKLNRIEAHQRSFTNLLILLFSLGMLLMMLWLHQTGEATFVQVLIATVSMMGSFGPVLALSNLANTLSQTLACGDRVLNLLDEKPETEEVVGGRKLGFDGVAAEDVTFAYDDEVILQNYSLDIEPGEVIGIHGASGSGKSTLLKLLMRFWDVDSGRVSMSNVDIREVDTAALRQIESYVTQDTYLFHDTIANNIAVGKPGARRAEIVEAAQKASIHDFVVSLPNGYDTNVGELGDTLSGGQRQRIGIARAFLHDAPLMLLDEPTSNLDSLNEGVILRSLREEADGKTVVMVSHRLSTLGMADRVVELESKRVS